jgi:endonuclease YncB( thermonuclease family)
MKTIKKISLAFSCTVFVALLMFSFVRIIKLNQRVRTLENIVYSPQELSLAPSTDLVQVKTAPPDGSQHKVLSVVDGDTIRIETAEGSLSVRIIGIDTPETVHPYKPVESGGYEASDRAKELLENQIVTIHFDPDPKHDKWDKYKRLLAYLDMPDGRDFGLIMVTEGLAKAYPKYPFSRQETYLEAEKIAQQSKIGIWAEQTDPNTVETNSFLGEKNEDDIYRYNIADSRLWRLLRNGNNA